MEWIEFKNIVNIIPGYAIPSSDMKEEGTPIIKITNIRDDGSLDLDNTSKYCKPITDRLRKFILKDKDVVVCMTGATIGKVARILKTNRNYLVNQRVCIVRAKNPKLQDYIYQVLSLSSFRKYVEIVGYGAAQPNISAASIAKFKFFANNSITIQQKIASILSAYDSLIENNIKRICLLEHMAENLYKEWFVRFRFPGHEHTEFVDGLPKGWKVLKIKDCYRTCSGGTPSREKPEYYINGSIPWVKTGEIQDSIIIDTEEKITSEALKHSSAKLLPRNSLLMAMYGVNIGKLGILTKQMSCNQAACAFLPNNEKKTFYYLFFYLRSIREYLLIIGFGAAQQNLSQSIINNIRITIPSEIILNDFERNIFVLYKQIELLQRQSALLARQRDLLLPRLMSGKLEVKA